MSGTPSGAVVANFMTSPAVTVTPGTGLKAIAAELRAGGFSALPVVDGFGRVVGMVSEADVLARASTPAVRRNGILACQVMTRPAVTVSRNTPVTQAAHLMHRYGLRRLPVIDGAGRPVGVVSRGDLLRVFLRSDADVRNDLLTRLGPTGLKGIEVTVEDGVVTLRGAEVESARAHRLSYLAERVDGVVAVRCLFQCGLEQVSEARRIMVDVPADEIETLSEAQCQELLRSHGFGRIAFNDNDQPLIFPVNYAADDRALVFRTAPGVKLSKAPMSKVAFEIDEIDEDHGVAWSVVVIGVAHEITTALDQLSERLRTLVVEPMAPGVRDSWIAVVQHGISGRRFPLR